MTECIFCRIVSGELPSSTVYEDDHVLAFMDIQPVNPGHVLVIPKEHAADLKDLDPHLGGYLFQVGQQVAAAIRGASVLSEGVNLLVADGEAAGQEVFHMHLHVIPRFANDGFGFHFSPHYHDQTEREELDRIAEELRSNLGG